LNGAVTAAAEGSTTTYRLAPALAVRMVGRSLVTLGALVALATVVGALLDAGWIVAGIIALAGLVVIGAWGWYLLRGARAVRLADDGYAVRLLGGVGATSASWVHVEEVVATAPAGQPCLVLRLRDGRSTRLPMAALATDPDGFAIEVRRRVRNAHSA
jgi:hypothetical protein